jgi:nitroreductase
MGKLEKDYYVKPRNVDHPIHQLIHDRWSPVVFAQDLVEEEKLLTLFEAARWAPSSYNEQPWHWVIGKRGHKSHDAILSTLAKPNQEWAQYAPIVGISVARLNFSKNGKPNRHALHDVGLAMGLMAIQAVDLELSLHQMAGFDVEKAREVLRIPSDCEPAAAFAIGYMANPKQSPHENLRQRDEAPGQRRALSQMVFEGEWSKALKGV